MGKTWEERREEKRQENRDIRRGRNVKLTAREKRKEHNEMLRVWEGKRKP